MKQMLHAELRAFNQLELREVPVPEPIAPDDVIVRIRACGICATDYKAIKGIRRNVEFPLIPGHEPSGTVAAVGAGVSNVQEGDDVICMPSGSCGFCNHCRAGQHHYCASAYTVGGDGPTDVRPGAFAEYMRIPASCLFHKPKNLSFEAAALTEPLSGAWKGLIQYSELQVGDDVVIIGAGSMGLLCVMVARAAGAGRLIVVDTSPFAREAALKVGATHAVDPTEGSPRDAVYDIMPDGPDLVLEAAGPVAAVECMVSLLRRGTRWNLFGITTPERFELEGGLAHFLEARMDASFGTNPLAMQKAIRLMERGVVDTAAIISHRFPLSEIHDALTVMENTSRTKVMINP